MKASLVQPTGVERKLLDHELIVSKSDLHGVITYVNDVFLRISGYTEAEVLGKPHSVLRHPEMPRAVFRLLWKALQEGRECFAYVVNLAKNGDHYWVHAHVTPTFGAGNKVVGYHSNRRAPSPDAIGRVVPVYRKLCAEEDRHGDASSAVKAGTALLDRTLQSAGMTYDQYVWELTP